MAIHNIEFKPWHVLAFFCKVWGFYLTALSKASQNGTDKMRLRYFTVSIFYINIKSKYVNCTYTLYKYIFIFNIYVYNFPVVLEQ